jgi:hypothetical protein
MFGAAIVTMADSAKSFLRRSAAGHLQLRPKNS